MKIGWDHITAFPLGSGWEIANGFIAGMLMLGVIYLVTAIMIF